MIIVSKAPLRISLLGGSTDIKSFFNIHTSNVFGGSIDKYVYVISNELSKFSNEKFRFTYRITESVKEVENFKHPVVRETLKIFNEIKCINISTMADLPGKTGLGSSSAFTVALIQNLALRQQKYCSPLEIAQTAINIERQIIEEPGGIQDQLHSAIGGLRFYKIKENKINFGNDFSKTNFGRKLNQSVLLVKVGKFRESKSVHFARGKLTKTQFEYLSEINKICLNFKKNFKPGSSCLKLLADSVNESWSIKSKMNKTSTSSAIEKIIRLGFHNGAVAAKLCGAGKSGFVLFICEPSSRLDLINLFGKEKCELIEFIKSAS
jgi:D-glycero-alpha-D-manno-heptose-7-phosphate kinase